MSTSPTTLLVVGDGVAPTGFARVVESVLARLPSHYDIHHLAVNYRGDPHLCPWKVYPASLGGDVYGIGRLEALVESLRPSLVFSINDLWIQARYWSALASLKERFGFRIVSYVAIDSAPVDPLHVENIWRVDRCVLYTHWAKAQVAAALPSGAAQCLDVIPHGVDIETFRPVGRGPFEVRESARSALGMRHLPGSFVVLNANRNQPRKRIDLTAEAFSRFSEGKPPGTRLYLHMGLRDRGWELARLARDYGIDERLVLSTDRSEPPKLGDWQLNAIYNACEVGLNTSTAEGWGLPALEHAATGAPQLVPDTPILREIWSEAAVFLPVALTAVNPTTMTRHVFVSTDAAAEALERLHSDGDFYDSRARACFERATSPEFSWDAIASRWDGLFRDVLSS